MPAGNYNINTEQGTTLTLHLQYKDSNNNAIDLSSHTGRMQVRRSPEDEQMLLFISSYGVTGGGVTGEFSTGFGVSGSGGITMNATNTGLTGLTGGIYLRVDDTTMSNMPTGNHFYDFEIDDGSSVVRLLSGRFSVDREITR